MVKVCNVANKHWMIKLLSFFSFISTGFPPIYPRLGLFLTSRRDLDLWNCMNGIRRYSSDKSWKSSILGIRFIENADLAVFSKVFLLLNNRKQIMRIKRALLKRHSNTDVFLWNIRNSEKHLLWRTSANVSFSKSRGRICDLNIHSV